MASHIIFAASANNINTTRHKQNNRQLSWLPLHQPEGRDGSAQNTDKHLSGVSDKTWERKVPSLFHNVYKKNIHSCVRLSFFPEFLFILCH